MKVTFLSPLRKILALNDYQRFIFGDDATVNSDLPPQGTTAAAVVQTQTIRHCSTVVLSQPSTDTGSRTDRETPTERERKAENRD